MNKPHTFFQIIPASPGWFIVVPVESLESRRVVDIDLDPVIAWRVESDTYEGGRTYSHAIPVGVELVNEQHFLQRPDGVIVIPEDRSFETKEGFIGYLNERGGSNAKRD